MAWGWTVHLPGRILHFAVDSVDTFRFPEFIGGVRPDTRRSCRVAHPRAPAGLGADTNAPRERGAVLAGEGGNSSAGPIHDCLDRELTGEAGGPALISLLTFFGNLSTVELSGF